jgi:hypothetical protein
MVAPLGTLLQAELEVLDLLVAQVVPAAQPELEELHILVVLLDSLLQVISHRQAQQELFKVHLVLVAHLEVAAQVERVAQVQ